MSHSSSCGGRCRPARTSREPSTSDYVARWPYGKVGPNVTAFPCTCKCDSATEKQTRVSIVNEMTVFWGLQLQIVEVGVHSATAAPEVW